MVLFVLLSSLVLFKTNLRFQSQVCNGCHDFMQELWVSMMLQLLLLKEIMIEFIFCIWAKIMSIKYIKNYWFDFKKWNIKKHINLLLHIKDD